jgi:N-carbamoylputrescine amidase
LKIALIQQHATKDKNGNISRGITALEEAVSNNANIIAFPELAFEYFHPQRPIKEKPLHLAEPIPGPTTEVFSDKAKEHGVIIILNIYERDGNHAYDCSPVINSDGKIIGKTRMVHILEAPNFHEKNYYTPGNLGAGVFNTSFGRIGIAICYDRHFPEYMRSLAIKGADLVFIPQAGAVGEWPPGIFQAEAQIAAFQNGYFTALVNRVGQEEKVEFAGESFVTDPKGRIIASAPSGKDFILYCEMNFEELKTCPARQHFLPDRRPEVYNTL